MIILLLLVVARFSKTGGCVWGVRNSACFLSDLAETCKSRLNETSFILETLVGNFLSLSGISSLLGFINLANTFQWVYDSPNILHFIPVIQYIWVKTHINILHVRLIILKGFYSGIPFDRRIFMTVKFQKFAGKEKLKSIIALLGWKTRAFYIPAQH